jgi:hypothetical protein
MVLRLESKRIYINTISRSIAEMLSWLDIVEVAAITLLESVMTN